PPIAVEHIRSQVMFGLAPHLKRAPPKVTRPNLVPVLRPPTLPVFAGIRQRLVSVGKIVFVFPLLLTGRPFGRLSGPLRVDLGLVGLVVFPLGSNPLSAFLCVMLSHQLAKAAFTAGVVSLG